MLSYNSSWLLWVHAAWRWTEAAESFRLTEFCNGDLSIFNCKLRCLQGEVGGLWKCIKRVDCKYQWMWTSGAAGDVRPFQRWHSMLPPEGLSWQRSSSSCSVSCDLRQNSQFLWEPSEVWDTYGQVKACLETECNLCSISPRQWPMGIWKRKLKGKGNEVRPMSIHALLQLS